MVIFFGISFEILEIVIAMVKNNQPILVITILDVDLFYVNRPKGVSL